MRVGCLEMHVYVKSSLGVLRREGCVPALCQKVSASPGSGLCRCRDPLCSVGRHGPAVGNTLYSSCARTFPYGSVSCSSVAGQWLRLLFPYLCFLLSELEESLLVLPFSYVPDLLRLFNEYIRLGAEVELLCRALLFLLK